MSKVLEMMKKHRSIRNYTGENVKDEDLVKIIEGAISAPTSVNGQQFSILIVDDEKKKEKLAELCGNQPWIKNSSVFMVFLMDFYKIAREIEKRGMEFKNKDSIESVMVGSVDCGLAFSNAMNVAEDLGYGVVPIGAIRREPFEVIDLLELPEYVYPVLGMCIGVEEGNQEHKPRLPYEAFVSVNNYNRDTEKYVEEYDKEILEYMNKRNDDNVHSWSDRVASIYSNIYFPKVKKSLEQQGFSSEK